MAIQLTDFHRSMIKTMAMMSKDGIAASGYLFGYQSARLDQFLQGAITKEMLADDAALIELLRTLNAKYCPQHLMEIADGIRELPGEDVQSGQ